MAVVLTALLAVPFMAWAVPVISATGATSPAIPVPLGTQILWDQSDSKGLAYASQNFVASLDACDIYGADDFIVGEGWSIGAIHVIGLITGGAGLSNATSLHWAIYADQGGFPAGYPGSGADPVWSISLAPGNAQVILRDSNSDVSLILSSPLSLPAGKYWLVFYANPSQQWFWATASSLNNDVAELINPGRCFAIGGGWVKILEAPICSTSHDFAFRLDGIGAGPGPDGRTIPTLDQWGMLFFALILAAASFLVIRRRVSERR